MEELDYIKLAQEVAKIAPNNKTEITLWGVVLLLALVSGYGLAWFIWKQYANYQVRVEVTLSNLDKTMTLVTTYLEGRHTHDEKVNQIRESLVKVSERLTNISDKIDKS